MGNTKFKKILMVLAFVTIVVLMAIVIWNLFFKSDSPIVPTPGEEDSPGIGLPISPDGTPIITDGEDPGRIEPEIPTRPQEPLDPQAGETGGVSNIAIGGVTKVSSLVDSQTVSPALSRDGNSVQFYNKDDGKFYVVNDNGDIIPFSDKVFHNVSDVEWAPNKTKAVIEYPDDTKIIYDFSTNKQVTLPKHWEDFTFSADSEKLVNKSLGIDPDNRWLIISNSDGSQTRALEELGLNDKWVIPYWQPNNQSVGMYTQGVDSNRREVFFIGQNGENFKSTIIEGWNFEPLWSENGDKLLYSVASPKDNLMPKVWIVNASGNSIGTSRTDLQLQTWASKCTFADNDTVYCAVPTSLEPMSGIFTEMSQMTSDELYRIDISSGQKTLIAIPEGNQNISSIMVDSRQETLFFTNSSGNIQKIQLK
ncbi:MAG: hypothetical protein WC280_01200 [Patescibacteria group bacterium]